MEEGKKPVENNYQNKQLEYLLTSMPVWGAEQEFETQCEILELEQEVVKTRLNNLNKAALELDDLDSNKGQVVKKRITSCSSSQQEKNSSILVSGTSTLLIASETVDNSGIINSKNNNEINILSEQQEDFNPNVDTRNGIRYTESLEEMSKPIGAGNKVFFMYDFNQPWLFGIISRIVPNKGNEFNIVIRYFVKEDENVIKKINHCSKYQVARAEIYGETLRAGKRVIAGTELTSLYSGIIAEGPAKHNKQRFLIFFDNGFVDYLDSSKLLPIIGQTPTPWTDSRKLCPSDCGRDLIAYQSHFFQRYPQRIFVLTKLGEKITLTVDDKVEDAVIVAEDCDINKLQFPDGHIENIYKGSPRFITSKDMACRLLRRAAVNFNTLHPDLLVDISNYHRVGNEALQEIVMIPQEKDGREDLRYMMPKRNRAFKSTTQRSTPNNCILVEYDRYPIDERQDCILLTNEEIIASNHKCGPECLNIECDRTELSVKDIVAEFRDCSDLKVPLLLGWKRFFAEIPDKKKTSRYQIVYMSPCKRIFSIPINIQRHLVRINSKMDLRHFSFDRDIKINRLANMKPVNAKLYIENIAVDENNKALESKNVSLINIYTHETLPQDFHYMEKTYPVKKLLDEGFSLNTEFKSSCECLEDCSTRADCHCHQLIEESNGSTFFQRGHLTNSIQYQNKRLNNPVSTGLFECNSFCLCKSTCPNRVVQNGLSFRLQVFKTKFKGWGVITMDDIPKGAFVCTYAAELLDNADEYGHSDMYYADLDFVSQNTKTKEGQDDEKSDEGIDSDGDDPSFNNSTERPKKNSVTPQKLNEENVKDCESSSSSSDEKGLSVEKSAKTPEPIQSRYPKREYKKPQPVNYASKEKPRFKRIHAILKCSDFTLDAKLRGNIGRFLNHSCDPNCFSQNVFIETHDLRLPTVAFFALRNIRAQDEITWNYNYKIGSIEGRRIDCHCGAKECAGRIL